MKIRLKHPFVQTLPLACKFQDLDVSLKLSSIPLVDNINLHRQVGEILYNDINKNQMTIDGAQDYIEKIFKNVKFEKIKPYVVFKHKEYYKDLIMKMGLDFADEVGVAAVIKESKTENLILRRQLKMIKGERV